VEIVLNENEIAKRETIDLSKTFVNMFYGRTVIPANLKKIKAKFDFNKLGVIIVHKNAYDDEAYRNLKTINGAVLDYDPTVNVYEIIDGNHRVTALQDLFGEKVKWECIILEDLPLKVRAEYFESYNSDSVKLTYTNKFKARLGYEEPDATAIKRIANDNHLLLADIDVPKPSRIKFGVCMAISSLERVYNTGTLQACLEILYSAYANTPLDYSANAYGNLSIRHLDSFIRTYEGEFSYARLVDVIRQMDSYFLNSESNINQDKSIKAKIVPMKIVENYNKHLGLDKKLDMSKLLLPFNPAIARQRTKG